MTEKERLEISKASYARIKGVIDQPGWSYIVGLLEKHYHEALDNIKKSDSPESRGVIKFIDSFMAEIRADISFGKNAQEKYVKKYLSNEG